MVGQARREPGAAEVGNGDDAVDEPGVWWPFGGHSNPYLANPGVDPMGLSLADIEEAMLALRAGLAQYRGVNEDGDEVYFWWTPEQRREIAVLRERLLAVSLAWMAALGH